MQGLFYSRYPKPEGGGSGELGTETAANEDQQLWCAQTLRPEDRMLGLRVQGGPNARLLSIQWAEATAGLQVPSGGHPAVEGRVRAAPAGESQVVAGR